MQLQQVLVNLCVNALQAMVQADTPQRSLHLRSLRGDHNDHIQVDVEDNGPGIPADQRDKVFDPMFTTKPGGMGMGLRICRSIIEAHGGAISVGPCRNGRGAAFRFALPLSCAPD